MIDLDLLAEKRAKSLNQQEDLWRKSVWSTEFQKLSQNMSDGEIELLIANCKSVIQLNSVVQFMLKRWGHEAKSPYGLLIEAAQESGLSLPDWMDSLGES